MSDNWWYEARTNTGFLQRNEPPETEFRCKGCDETVSCIKPVAPGYDFCMYCDHGNDMEQRYQRDLLSMEIAERRLKAEVKEEIKNQRRIFIREFVTLHGNTDNISSELLDRANAAWELIMESENDTK